jgi:hypothetical protein
MIGLLVGCTAKKSEPKNDSPFGLIVDSNGSDTKEGEYEFQKRLMPRTAKEICQVKAFCTIENGELIGLMEKCVGPSYDRCQKDEACKSARAQLIDSSRYADEFGGRIRVANMETHPQIISYGADKKPGGSGLDADIVFDLVCD